MDAAPAELPHLIGCPTWAITPAHNQMEDDGLLLNFAAPTGPVKPKIEVVGGSWKDRQAYRISQRKPRGLGSNSIAVKTRPAPRASGRDLKDEPKKRTASDSRATKKPRTGKPNPQPHSETQVSSLFTSNMASTTAETVDETLYTPSNAPLNDSGSSGFGVNPRLCAHLALMKYEAPTKVQRAVIPRMAADADLFVKAQTGSGKTLAFLLPIVERLSHLTIERLLGLYALILTPTRELATQIYSVLELLLRCHHHIVPGIVVGGEKKKSEKARLRKGVNVLVATPGRLADHLESTKVLNVSKVRWLVLDEGDRLVELGFHDTICQITDKLESSFSEKGLPLRRVNVLCSATMPADVEKLGTTVLSSPEMVSVDDTATAPDQLVQRVMVVPPKLRLVTLAAVLKQISNKESHSRSIVFFSCSDSVNFHFDVFTRGHSDEELYVLAAPQIADNASVFRLHGSLTQQLRTLVMKRFVETEEGHSVLFCTDVASRGLDLPNIANVVEYDPPFSLDDHLHRIGRSARAGAQGEAALFLLPGAEEGYVKKLEEVHPKRGSLRVVNYEAVLTAAFAADNTTKSDPKAKEGKWDIHATTWHLNVERWLLEDAHSLKKASQAFTSHVRAYATHLLAEKIYFNVKTLHLGHLAKSFGLRETPSALGKSNAKKKEDPRKKLLKAARRAERSAAAEFNY